MDVNHDTGTIGNIAVFSPSVSTVTFSGTGGVLPFTGNTAQRPGSPVAGTWRYNTDSNKTEYFTGTAWQQDVVTIAGANDTTITSPAAGQMLQYNGTTWINSTTTPSSISGTINTWTLSSGNLYYNTFTHGLGTQNIIVQLFDTTTNAVVQADSIVASTVSAVTVTVYGNTRSLRIVVIANGMTIGVMNGGGVPAIIEGLYSAIPGTATAGTLYLAYDSRVLYRYNGSAWDIMSASSGTVKAYTYYANSLDSPNTADFAVNALAPVISDPSNTAMNVRSFSNTVEQGVGLMMPVPLGANFMSWNIRGRPTTAPGSATTVTHNIYVRQVPNNAALGSWSAAIPFTALSIPTNAYYQYYSQQFTLATLGLTTGQTYHFELTRATGGLTNPWLVVEISVVFT